LNPSGKKKSILLVDDEEGVRKVLGIALADMGYNIHTAANGSEALDIFRKMGPPIVLTDIKMPGMDGIELLKAIKQEISDTEVVMITGHGDLDLAIKSLKFEATDFITKPIHDDALEIALKRVEERISVRRQLADYTEKLELLVEEKSQKLIEAERLTAIGQTVAGLSHTIKNIASGLKGGAFILEKGFELEKMTYLNQGWEMVKGNVDKIAKLSLDLLNYAKTAEINYQACDPNQPAREVVEILTPVAEECGVGLALELIQNPDPFLFDPEGIHRCLFNLVTNAIDACKLDVVHEREKEVSVRVMKTDGGEIAYQVKDNGSGMDDETQKKLFQYFFTTKGNRGNGIGLMMTKNIVEKHHGIIEVQSEKNAGTTFTITLPNPEKK